MSLLFLIIAYISTNTIIKNKKKNKNFCHIRFIDLPFHHFYHAIQWLTSQEYNSSTNTLIKAYSSEYIQLFEKKKKETEREKERDKVESESRENKESVTSLASRTLFKRYFVKQVSIKFLNSISTEAGFNPATRIMFLYRIEYYFLFSLSFKKSESYASNPLHLDDIILNDQRMRNNCE